MEISAEPLKQIGPISEVWNRLTYYHKVQIWSNKRCFSIIQV